jgi:antitoxin component YwqK of YwqJK toxin-antitoxin module
MEKVIRVCSIVILLIGCKATTQKQNPPKKIDMVWLDSIIKRSDTSYSKNYYRTDFVTAHYYISKKDSTLCQLMKDSAQRIRKVILTEKKIVKYSAQYYETGQLMEALSFDEKGRLSGNATTYFENGIIKTEGNYTGGLKTGMWKEFDLYGNTKIIKYDSNGIKIN